MNHDLYLLVAFLTHALVGYAVVAGLTDLPRAAAVVGALLPDLDLYLGPVLGLPVVHRGVLHTPSAALALAGGVWLVGSLVGPLGESPGRSVDALGVPGAVRVDAPRRVAAALGVGLFTHLLIDTSTDAGVMWLYPASTARASLGVPIHGATGTAALWFSSLALVLVGPRLGRWIGGGGASQRRE